MRGLIFGLLASFGLLISGAHAQSALTGQVTSAEEGPMEGVLVSAKRAGSTITVTVATDAAGRYSFPAWKLEPSATISMGPRRSPSARRPPPI